jgi:hydroxymethylpyrimidine/phosphomethylpyrimidine kinase
MHSLRRKGRTLKKVLTIAGSDSSGGAGIQADLKTICAQKMYGMSAITALTAQNTMGVAAVQEVAPEFIAQQLDCIFTDIFPDAVKVGMVSNVEAIAVIADKLREYHPSNIVIDPVMVSTSGARLLREDAAAALIATLLPLGDIITPNILEAQELCGFEIADEGDMEQAALMISQKCRSRSMPAAFEGKRLPVKGAVLIKGGHFDVEANDLLKIDDKMVWVRAGRIETNNTHGTGCTLSSAIACNLAAGMDVYDAVAHAKEYLTGALAAKLDLGHGNGPVDHLYNMLPCDSAGHDHAGFRFEK